MPIIRIELLPGRTNEQKAEYSDKVTKLTAEILLCQESQVDVIFTEISSSDWAKSGRLLYKSKD